VQRAAAVSSRMRWVLWVRRYVVVNTRTDVYVTCREKLSKRMHNFISSSLDLTEGSSIAVMVANRSTDDQRCQVLILAPLALLDQ